MKSLKRRGFLALSMLLTPAVFARPIMRGSRGGGGGGVDDPNYRYVRAGASGTGSGLDWTNAFTSIPGTLTRGLTYWLADGSAAGRAFNTANSGTTLITLKKATPASHGTATGWSDAYGAGQFEFTSDSQVLTDYWVFDGQKRNADWRKGTVNDYGIKMANIRHDNGSGVGCDHVTYRYCDIHGGGRDTGDGDDVIYSLVSNDTMTWQYCALRDSDRTIWITAGGVTNWVIDQCYIARNTSTGAIHGEMWSCWGDATNVQFSNNHVEDIEGTAFIAGINDGTMSQWDIYGNVFKYTDSMLANTGRPPVGSGVGEHNGGVSGLMYVANDASNTNFADNIRFYNNSIHAVKGASGRSGIFIEAGAGSNEVRNNLWYDNASANHNIVGGSTFSHNWYYLTTSTTDSGTGKQTGTADPFVDEDNSDYHLTTATNAGFSLSSPYNIDPDGVTRGADSTWDRGAFEKT